MSGKVCVLGYSPADILGVFPQYLLKAGECERIYTLSYFSYRALYKIAREAEKELVLVGHMAMLAPLVAETLRNKGVRLVGAVAWRREKKVIEGVGGEVVFIEIPYYYKKMENKLKRLVAKAIRMLEATEMPRYKLARLIRETMPITLELAEAYNNSSNPELDPNTPAEALLNKILRELGVDSPEELERLVDLSLKRMRPKTFCSDKLLAVKVYTVRLHRHSWKGLLQVAAERLLTRDRIEAAITIAKDHGDLIVAGISRTPWILTETAKACRIISGNENLVITPTTIEGVARPGSRLEEWFTGSGAKNLKRHELEVTA
ncbi:MAG: hypothetical protein F7C35_03275 [Desulfurococcales archaeon]|nr:hypothetical protein [Desulfurococcales archaeon]